MDSFSACATARVDEHETITNDQRRKRSFVETFLLQNQATEHIENSPEMANAKQLLRRGSGRETSDIKRQVLDLIPTIFAPVYLWKH